MNSVISNGTDSAHIVVLITQSVHSELAQYAYEYCKTALAMGHNVRVFFYADGATVANKLIWQSADRENYTHAWQQLALEYQLALKVCVSTALARGITDEVNAARHELSSVNLAEGFSLVGLTDFIMMLDSSQVIQF